MLDVFKRERWNNAYIWEQSMTLLGSVLGAKPEALIGIVSKTKRTMLQRLFYTYYGAGSLIDDLKSKRKALQTDQGMFDRLDSM